MRIQVRCVKAADGHRCAVDVGEGASSSHHKVDVNAADLKRWGRGRSVEELVHDSFVFLLEREAKESILPEFKLSVIGRYFPEYDREITRGRP